MRTWRGMSVYRLVKFTAVGLSIAGYHYAAAVLMVERGGLPAPVANSIAFLTAAALSYTLQTLWTFESRFTQRNAVRFVAVLLIGVAVSWSTSTGVAWADLPYRLGVLIVLFLIPGLNFLLHHFWTYAAPELAPPRR
jgi:putative flippase GtrA